MNSLIALIDLIIFKIKASIYYDISYENFLWCYLRYISRSNIVMYSLGQCVLRICNRSGHDQNVQSVDAQNNTLYYAI